VSKILIITIGRTGSTNLSKGLAANLNLKLFDEPFNPSLNKYSHDFNLKKLKTKKSLIVKHIWFHTPVEYNYKNFLQEFITYFDKIFMLVRSNIKEHYESLVNLKYRTNTKVNVFEKYNYNDIPSKFKEDYKNILTIEKLSSYVEYLHNFSIDNNIPILYYEKLYSEDIHSNVDYIRKFIPEISENINTYLNPVNRQRFDTTSFTLI